MTVVVHWFTPHFSADELACKDGTPVPEEYWYNAQMICERAEQLRRVVGPLIVVSAYRTKAHNTKIGGAKRSLHLTASALDLKSQRWDAKILHDQYLNLIRDDMVPDGGLGLYPKFIHIDLGRARRWRG